MNWYKLDVVRDVLRLDSQAELAPSGVGRVSLEAWRRVVDGHAHSAFLSYENQEFLCPEDSLLAAAVALAIGPPGSFLSRVKAKGGLWTGPSPAQIPTSAVQVFFIRIAITRRSL